MGILCIWYGRQLTIAQMRACTTDSSRAVGISGLPVTSEQELGSLHVFLVSSRFKLTIDFGRSVRSLVRLEPRLADVSPVTHTPYLSSSMPQDERADKDRLDEPFIRPVLGLTEQDSWRSALDLPGPQSLRILSEFLQELGTDRLRQLTPAQHLLTKNHALPDTSGSDGRVDVAAINSSMIIAHSGRGFAFDLTLDDALGESTQAIARWFDPRSGRYSPAGRLDITSTPITFSPPSTGTTDDDWVLVIGSDTP